MSGMNVIFFGLIWLTVAFVWVSILVRQSIEERYTASQSEHLSEDGV